MTLHEMQSVIMELGIKITEHALHYFQTIVNYILELIHSFFNASQMPSLMHGVGLACITILIPIAIAIFFSNNGMVFAWEKKVLLDQVIKAKLLLFVLGLLFIPSFLWTNNFYFNTFLFLSFVMGIWLFIKMLKRMYYWIYHYDLLGKNISTDYRHKMRKEYIKNISGLDEISNVWAEIFGVKINNIWYEKSYIQLFIDTINKLLGKRELQACDNLMASFVTNIEKREMVYLDMFADLFRAILKWCSQINVTNEKEMRIGHTLDDAVQACVSYSLTHRFCSHFFFKVLEEYFKDKNNQKEKNEKLLNLIIPVFYNGVGCSADNDSIWSIFPEEWKVTLDNVANEDNLIMYLWFDNFLRWAHSRINGSKNYYDKELDDIARNLFPKIDPMWWAEILTFVLHGGCADIEIRYLVEHRPLFGSVGRAHSGSGSFAEAQKSMDAQIDSEHKEVIGLALKLFPGYFTKECLEKCLQTLNELSAKTTDNDEQFGRINKLTNIFSLLAELQDLKIYL